MDLRKKVLQTPWGTNLLDAGEKAFLLHGTKDSSQVLL